MVGTYNEIAYERIVLGKAPSDISIILDLENLKISDYHEEDGKVLDHVYNRVAYHIPDLGTILGNVNAERQRQVVFQLNQIEDFLEGRDDQVLILSGKRNGKEIDINFGNNHETMLIVRVSITIFLTSKLCGIVETGTSVFKILVINFTKKGVSNREVADQKDYPNL